MPRRSSKPWISPTVFTLQHPWPEQLDAGMAARFCGERSVSTFRRKVKQAFYPRPTCCRGSRQMWHTETLRSHLAVLHGRHDYRGNPDPVKELFG